MKNVCVIGGGAAGLMAAYAAAKKGNHVILFEKNEKLGKKIYITGKDVVILQTTLRLMNFCAILFAEKSF